MGSRAGLIVRPDVFWQSIDGGPLWRFGQWLEIVKMPWSSEARRALPPRDAVAALVEKASSGSDRQKYAAICLLGELLETPPGELPIGAPSAGWTRPGLESLVSEAGDIFANAAGTAAQPGVAAAGLWAAGRIRRKIEGPLSQCFFRDQVSGLTFVRVPGCEQFRLQAWPEMEPVPLRSVHWSTTEVTLAAFEKFFEEFGQDENLFGEQARGVVGQIGTTLAELLDAESGEPPEIRARRAANWVSLKAADRFCRWLSERGGTEQPSRSYRLPTEEEWEWACRGANTGMFCYGDDARYLTFFAKSDGTLTGHYLVAERMPNYYGLFDMHGDVWEWTNSVHVDRRTGQPERDDRGEPYYIPRGGAFYSPGNVCGSGMRENRATQDAETEYLGFRIVMELLP
jgi:formylglycine-generating enzyme required for sulfatase activity